MPDLTAQDVDVTLDTRDMDYSAQALTKSYPTIDFGDGALTYPANGIPLPDLGKLGMKFRIKRLYISQPPDGYEYRYDKSHGENGTIRIFENPAQTGDAAAAAPLAELGHVAVPATTLELEVIGQ